MTVDDLVGAGGGGIGSLLMIDPGLPRDDLAIPTKPCSGSMPTTEHSV